MNTDDTAGEVRPRRRRRWPWYCAICILVLLLWQVVAWLAPVPAPLASAAAVTDRVYEAVYDEDIAKRAAALPREVNIVIVGLDNRIASNDNHADAIHLITIRTRDSVGATISSIPRGTDVDGYGIATDLSFMANVRALRGRKTFLKAVAKLARKKSIDYYVEVSFSQVMGVLELLGYKDPATALQFLRHRKSYPLGDVQRSYNQGKFIRQQVIRRGDMLTGAKGDLLIRMGLGMVDTDLDLETAQALVYVMKNAEALNEEHIALTMIPKANLARLDGVEIPDPEDIGEAVEKLVRKTGDDIDDLGRYNPYPRLNELVGRAAAQKSPRGVVATLGPVYAQKAWLQVQERPQRHQLRDKVEELLVRAYTELKKPEKGEEVSKYMAEERKAFSETEKEQRHFSYGMRKVTRKSEKLDPVAVERAKIDDIKQKQTHIEPQAPDSAPTAPVDLPPVPTVQDQAHVEDTPKQEEPAAEKPSTEPQVHDIKADGAQQ